MFAALSYVQVLQIVEVYFHTVVKPVLPAPRISKASFFFLSYVVGNGLRSSLIWLDYLLNLIVAARRLCDLVSCIFRQWAHRSVVWVNWQCCRCRGKCQFCLCKCIGTKLVEVPCIDKQLYLTFLVFLVNKGF